MYWGLLGGVGGVEEQLGGIKDVGGALGLAGSVGIQGPEGVYVA